MTMSPERRAAAALLIGMLAALGPLNSNLAVPTE